MKFIAVVIAALILLMALMPPLAARLETSARADSQKSNISRISAPIEDADTGYNEVAEVDTPDELITVFRHSTGEVLELSMDEYLTGVVAAEMYSSYEPEALKAQAVAARSYCEYKRSRTAVPSHPDAMICDDSSHCEAFMTLDEACGRWGDEYAEAAWSKIGAAVSEVSGLLLTYGGKAANALYHASSRLATESAGALWQDSPPYLVSVSTPEADSVETLSFTPERFSQILKEAGVCVSGEPDGWISAITRTASGRASSVCFCGGELSGTEVRSVFGLRSCDFELYYLDGVFNFVTHGYGHGIGMSQAGAQAMALNGAGWRDILAHYYPGTEIS